MTNINISNARNNFYKIASTCIKYNDVVNISTKSGNVILMSGDDYDSLIDSLCLACTRKDIEELVKTSTNEFNKRYPWR